MDDLHWRRPASLRDITETKLVNNQPRLDSKLATPVTGAADFSGLRLATALNGVAYVAGLNSGYGEPSANANRPLLPRDPGQF